MIPVCLSFPPSKKKAGPPNLRSLPTVNMFTLTMSLHTLNLISVSCSFLYIPIPNTIPSPLLQLLIPIPFSLNNISPFFVTVTGSRHNPFQVCNFIQWNLTGLFSNHEGISFFTSNTSPTFTLLHHYLPSPRIILANIFSEFWFLEQLSIHS